MRLRGRGGERDHPAAARHADGARRLAGLAGGRQLLHLSHSGSSPYWSCYEGGLRAASFPRGAARLLPAPAAACPASPNRLARRPKSCERPCPATLRGRGGVFANQFKTMSRRIRPALSYLSHGPVIAGPDGPFGGGLRHRIAARLDHARRAAARAAAAPHRLFGGRAAAARPDRGPGRAAVLDPGRAARAGRRLAAASRARRCPPSSARARRLRSLLPPRRAGGPVVVTSLNLKLYGVREDRATGRGSAIIALPDGRQLSFAVGEEIMPGVTLTAVGFDNVTISRGGARRADLPRPVRAGAAVAGGHRATAPRHAAGRGARRRTPGACRRRGRSTSQPRIAGGRDHRHHRHARRRRRPGVPRGRLRSPATSSSRSTASASPRSSRRASAAAGSGGEVNVMVDRGGRAVAAAG